MCSVYLPACASTRIKCQTLIDSSLRFMEVVLDLLNRSVYVIKMSKLYQNPLFIPFQPWTAGKCWQGFSPMCPKRTFNSSNMLFPANVTPSSAMIRSPGAICFGWDWFQVRLVPVRNQSIRQDRVNDDASRSSAVLHFQTQRSLLLQTHLKWVFGAARICSVVLHFYSPSEILSTLLSVHINPLWLYMIVQHTQSSRITWTKTFQS